MYAFGVCLLACVYLFCLRASSPKMLQDSDTRVLVAELHKHPEPFRWFTGDWPLQNHFYRPISTAVFQFDDWAYGNRAAGWGTTNVLLLIGCVLTLFWFIREFTDRPIIAAASSVLFVSWLASHEIPYRSYFWLLSPLCLFGGLLRHGFSWSRTFAPALAVLFAIRTLNPLAYQIAIMITWIPARTASSMMIFAMAAMALYARSIRLGCRREAEEEYPITPPATRSTVRPSGLSESGKWILYVVSLVMFALALGCYEQAVMLPLAILVVAGSYRFRGYAVRFVPVLGFFVILVGYVLLRRQLVPPAPSGYQLQQFRHGMGVVLSLLDFLAPTLASGPSIYASLSLGPIALLAPDPWFFVLGIGTEVAAVVVAYRRWVLLLSGYLLSVIAFGPMAFLKIFGHYYLWPMGFRAMFAIVMVGLAWEAMLSAWTPRSRQAPLRLHPAPGSLPHP